MPRALCSLLLALLAAACAAGGPGPTVPGAAETADATIGPEPGSEASGEIDAGERHSYRLDVGKDRWVTIELEQHEIDVALILRDRSGEEIASIDPPGSWSSDGIDLITADDGPYSLEIVGGAGSGRPGTYRLRLAEERAAGPDDAARATARRLLRALERPSGEEPAPTAADKATLLAGLLDSPEVSWSDVETAQILNQRGAALLAQGDAAAAAAEYRAGLERLAAGVPRALAAHLGIGLAQALVRQGTFEEARRRYRWAVEVATAADDPDAFGMAVNHEALFLFERGEAETASRLLQEALESGRLTANPPARVAAHLNLALFLRGLGDLDAALVHYEQAATLSREAVVGSPAARFSLLRSGALLQRAAGEVEAALATLDEALQLALDEADSSWEMSIRIHLGSLLSQLGEDRDARRHLERSARLAESAGNRDYLARTLLSLAWIDLGEDDPAAAARSLEQNLASEGLNSELVAANRFALATAKRRLGDADGARDLLSSLLDDAERRGLHLPAADAHRALGSLHLEADDLEAAATALERAAALAETIGDPFRRAAASSLLARLEAARGSPRLALDHVLSAIDLRERVRSRLVDPELRSSFLARWRSDYELGIELAMRLAAEEPDGGHDRLAFSLSEAAHARTLTELLAEARVDVRQGISPELLAAERQADRRLSRLQSRLTELFRQAAPEASVAALREEWEEASRQRREVEWEIRRRHPRYAEIRYPQPPGVVQVQSWLPAGTAVLEYALGEHSSTLFVLTRDRFLAVPLPPGVEIAALVGTVRRDILGRSGLARSRLEADLAELGRLLVAPAADLLGGLEHLLVVPDRDLFHLPFEALPDPAAPELGPGGLLRRWSVTYLPSAAVLPHLGAESEPAWESDLLVFADPPPPAGAPGARLPSLPGARREAERIAALFPADRVELFVGGEARESLLKTPGATAPARRLHIASHGVISVRDARESYVLLAPDPPEDGRLHLHEVFNLELAAELVVLSGCETGLGPRLEGEGLIGLARGFLYAGARDMVVSLWSVADDATADLMVDFYRQLLAGRSPAEALRIAKLDHLDRTGAVPFAWAPFIVYGAAATSPR
ncbi:MAG TPA: CHAT domain-containing protein [Thermoanaerobaculia bacterium]|nr:CHAT domain-containing protein [Thermoanaerobaculia bacterium]